MIKPKKLSIDRSGQKMHNLRLHDCNVFGRIVLWRMRYYNLQLEEVLDIDFWKIIIFDVLAMA